MFTHFSIKDHFLNISLVLFFVLPQSLFLYLFVPVAMILLIDKNRSPDVKTMLLLLLLCSCIFVSLFLNINEQWVDNKSYFKMLQLIILFICFGRLSSSSIKKGYLIAIAIYIVLFQFAYQIDIPAITDFMENLYPLSDEDTDLYSYLKEKTFNDIGGYNVRFGSIYYNSNICASLLEILLVLIIMEKKQFTSISFYSIILLLSASIISTGSRTSFLVVLVIAILFFGKGFFREKGKIVFLGLLLFLYSFFNIYNYRLFQLEQGVYDSFNVKIDILHDYLGQLNSPAQALFGCFSTNALLYKLNTLFPGTDFDIGDIIVSYGYLFFFFLLLLLIRLFLLLRDYRFLFCILLWCFSNTIFMSYRASSIYILVLSIYYNKSIHKEKMLH